MHHTSCLVPIITNHTTNSSCIAESSETVNLNQQEQEQERIEQPHSSKDNVGSEKTVVREFNGRKRKSKEAIQREELDINTQSLNLVDNVPNKSGKVVTLREVLDKSAQNEGFIDFIMTHREVNDRREYQVKWIGYRSPTWEVAENLPKPDLEEYFLSNV